MPALAFLSTAHITAWQWGSINITTILLPAKIDVILTSPIPKLEAENLPVLWKFVKASVMLCLFLSSARSSIRCCYFRLPHLDGVK